MPDRPLVDIDALAWLDPPLLTHRTLAGRSYDVKVGDRDAVLTLPSDGADHLSDPSSERGPIRRFPHPRFARALTEGAEIRLTSRRPVRKEIIVVDCVRLRWRDTSPSRPSCATGPMPESCSRHTRSG